MAYVRGAILVAFLALISLALWYRSSATSAEADAAKARAETASVKADLKVATDANKAQEETIGRLRAEADLTDRVTAEFAGQLRAINDQISETNRALDALKGEDETVRDYLGAPVPDPLRRLYDR